MLAAILLSYAVIIGFGDTGLSDPLRIVLLVFLVWTTARLYVSLAFRRAVLALGVVAFLTTAGSAIFALTDVTYGLVGGWSVVLIGLAIGAIAGRLLGRWHVDTATVLGALCIYLLFALFFSGVNQTFATFGGPYLNGVQNPPSPPDLLYFSVITMTTVGYGDITPASEAARAVAVVEALTGQLYLVSVVAGVVGGWRAPGRDQGCRETERAD
jgi:hypothetical protein